MKNSGSESKTKSNYFSNMIKEKASCPLFQVSIIDNTYNYVFELHKLNTTINVGFDIVNNADDDELFSNLVFKTDLVGPYLGLLDGMFSLMQGKAIEAVDRIAAKELDHYLRDEPTRACVNYYDPKFYAVLSVGEMIVNAHYKKEKIETLLYDEFCGEYLDLSFSEQIEVFEEFLSKHIYKDEKYAGFSFDIEDIRGDLVEIRIESITGAVLCDQLISGLQELFLTEIRDMRIKVKYN